MRFFFRSRQFKVIATVFCIVAALIAIFTVLGSRMAPQTDIAGTIAQPFRSAFIAISDTISNLFSAYNEGNEIMLENTELKSEIEELRQQIADYNDVTAQNEFYKEYLGIKEAHSDFEFAPATLISRDNDDPYGSFVINRGSLAGIKKHDPVITQSGLVGFISEVGLTSCKVTTILSHELTLGALDNRTSDSGIITGKLELAEKGLCRLANLSRSCSVAIGDYVVTSGEGIFPAGLLVGSIESIGSDEYNTSIYAEVKPFTNIFEIRNVMVITSFEGQGGIAVGSEEE